MTTNESNGVRWVNVDEFALKFNKPRPTVYDWVRKRYLLELGFIIHRSSDHRVLIGVPPTHECYSDFAP